MHRFNPLKVQRSYKIISPYRGNSNRHFSAPFGLTFTHKIANGGRTRQNWDDLTGCFETSDRSLPFWRMKSSGARDGAV